MTYGRILASEDSATDDASDTSRTDKSGRCESSLPLSADIVRLEGKDARDIGVAAHRCHEDSEVACACRQR